MLHGRMPFYLLSIVSFTSAARDRTCRFQVRVSSSSEALAGCSPTKYEQAAHSTGRGRTDRARFQDVGPSGPV